MHNKAENDPFLDPRTFLLLLILANIITFCQDSLWIEAGWIGFADSMMLLSGKYRMAGKWLLSYAALLLLQWVILPVLPESVSVFFIILVNYSIRMFPCLIIGAFMIKEISLRRFVLAMRKLHFPEKLVISLSVTIRYFPAIKEEACHIREAMSLRGINRSKRLEAMLVALMMSATAAAEKISAAAVTRGIENPEKKTSLLTLKLHTADYVCGIIGCFFLTATFLLG
ncbi:MAG: energy-coupling factor transporter transmembrane component T [Lachnospiraceae bacterium]